MSSTISRQRPYCGQAEAGAWVQSSSTLIDSTSLRLIHDLFIGGPQYWFLGDNNRGHSVVSVGDAKEIAGDHGTG